MFKSSTVNKATFKPTNKPKQALNLKKDISHKIKIDIGGLKLANQRKRFESVANETPISSSSNRSISKGRTFRRKITKTKANPVNKK